MRVFGEYFVLEGINGHALRNKFIDDYKEGLSLEVRLQWYGDGKVKLE